MPGRPGPQPSTFSSNPGCPGPASCQAPGRPYMVSKKCYPFRGLRIHQKRVACPGEGLAPPLLPSCLPTSWVSPREVQGTWHACKVLLARHLWWEAQVAGGGQGGEGLGGEGRARWEKRRGETGGKGRPEESRLQQGLLPEEAGEAAEEGRAGEGLGRGPRVSAPAAPEVARRGPAGGRRNTGPEDHLAEGSRLSHRRAV